jgi:protein-S-isoprenylcysteine O-methyltransferase Ste14
LETVEFNKEDKSVVYIKYLMEIKDAIRACIYIPLMFYQFYLSWRFYNNQGYAWVTNLGWLILSLSALFGWLPIYEFKKHGGVPRDKSYVHTSKLVTSGVYSVVRHPQFLAGILICVSMMLISQHPYSLVAGTIASIVYASEVPSADKKLVDKFGGSYLEYKKRVSALNFIRGLIRRITGK